MAAVPVINMVIPQGTDFQEIYQSSESDGTPTNLTNYTAFSKLKKHPSATTAFDFNIGISSEAGQVAIGMTSGLTIAIKPGRYFYDVFIKSPVGKVTRLVQGQAEVTAGISTSLTPVDPINPPTPGPGPNDCPDDIEGLGDTDFGTLDQSKDGMVVSYDAATDKFVLITADDVLSESARDEDIPDDFIDQVEDEIDLGDVQIGELDAGGF